VGVVKPGKLADLIIVDGDPLAQIFDLVNIQGVMLNGVYRQRADILQTGDSLPNLDR
jgi:imidazolonepropionase-like amidohydrolase